MKRHLKFLAIGGLAFALFLLARLPASVLVDQLGTYQVFARGLTGTVWRGSAQGIDILGMQLGPSSWQFRFLSLLRARPAVSFNTTIGGESLSGIAASRGRGQVRLTNVMGRIPIEALAAYLPTGFFTGTAQIDLSKLELLNNWPVAIDGQLLVQDVKALTTRPPTAFGDYEVSFTEQNEAPLTGILRDVNGPVELSGQLQLEADRSFKLDATLMPRPGASPQISNMLNFVGPLDNQGRRTLSFSGRY